MNTNIKDKKTDEVKKPRIRFLYSKSSNNFTNFFDSMDSVDLNSSTAKLNETSIDDNRGGRIELNQDNIIKK